MPKKRNVGRKNPAPLFHIFCEGEKTEPNYLNCYLKMIHSAWQRKFLIKIEDIEENEPISLIERAIKTKKETRNKDDIFWCVYDRESPIKYVDRLHKQARELANKKGISIALSNVCFEVWLLLHRQSNCAAYDSYDELWRRSNLKRLFANYNKNYQFDLTCAEFSRARDNAKRMNAQTLAGASSNHDTPHQLNPYTDVYKLLDAIDEFVANNP